MAEQRVAIIINAKDDATSTLKGIGSALGSLGKVAAGLALGAAAGVGVLAYGITSLAMDAAAIEPVRIGFTNLAASIGETADSMLVELRGATRGMISDAELMQAGSKLMAMGLAGSKEEAAKLTEMATRLGMAMGEEAGPAIENFTLMLANQSIPRLDSFGIASTAVRARIEELQAATEGMSREEAFMIAVMEQGDVALAKIGDTGGTAQEGILRFQASMANLKDNIGQAFLPVFSRLLDTFNDLIQQYSPQIQAFAERFAAWLETKAIPAVVAFAEHQAWPAIQAIFNWITGTGLPAAQNAFTTTWPIIRDAVVNAINWIMPKVQTAWALLQDFWERMQPRLQSAFEDISRTIREDLAPRMTELWEKSEPARKVLMQIAAQVAEWIAQGGLKMLELHLDALVKGFDAMVSAVKWAIQAYNDVKATIEGVVNAITSAIQWVKDLGRAFTDLVIPDWLVPGSPSPLEEAIRGIGQAINALPGSVGMSAALTPAPAMAGAGGAGGGTVNNIGPIYVSASTYAEGLAGGRGLVDALRERGLQIG